MTNNYLERYILSTKTINTKKAKNESLEILKKLNKKIVRIKLQRDSLAGDSLLFKDENGINLALVHKGLENKANLVILR